MAYDSVLLIGRIIFSIMFIASGIGHFAELEGSAGYAKSRGLGDNSQVLVQISGACLLAGGAATLLGIWVDLALLLLAVLVLIIAFVMHQFWGESDPMAKQNEMSMFMKNLTIAGGALMGSAIYGAGDGFNDGTLIDSLGIWSI